MKRLLSTAVLILFCLPLFCRPDDRALVEKALAAPAVKDSTSRSAWHFVRDQISGSCKFETECVDFLPQALKEVGPLGGTLAWLDRVTRCSRIGTALYPRQMLVRGGRIREDAEAYRRRRRDE